MPQIQYFIFSSKIAGMTETKLHVEPPWDRGMKICSWDLGQMIKIFPMFTYGKNPLKIFFSGLKRPKTLKIVMQHLGLWLYQIYSNGDHWLTLTYFKYEKYATYIKIKNIEKHNFESTMCKI